MKALLPAIRDALLVSDIVTTESDIYITPDPRWRPEGTGTPCIGIRGGPLVREELGGEMWELTATVNIAAFVALTANWYTTMTEDTDIYDILDEVTGILNDNRLNLSEVQRVHVGGDSQSSLMQGPDNTWLVTIVREFTYTLERSSV